MALIRTSQISGSIGGTAFPFSGSAVITGSLLISGSETITGSLNVTQGITGSLFGTSSWSTNAITASYIITAQTASYVLNATSASFAQTSSYVKNAVSASYVLNAISSSYALNATTASYVNPLNQNVVITGSLSNGLITTATGNYSHAEGGSTSANGYASHAEGNSTTATGDYSHAEGATTQAIGLISHAEGGGTQAAGEASHAEGLQTIASGSYSHAEGNITKAIGDYSHAEGDNTQAVGNYSHAEGQETITSGSYSHAEGYNSQAIGTYSHAEGYSTKTGTQTAHQVSITSGLFFISGNVTSLFTQGNYLYLYDVEFDNTYQYASFLINSVTFDGTGTRIVLADNSVNAATAYVGDLSYFRTNATFGGDKTIPGNYSHTEGQNTIALGLSSHAEGQSAQAVGIGSHAEGYNTQAVGNYQHVQGTFNLPLTSPSAFILGNGVDDANRSNLIFAAGSEVQITGSLIVTQGITGDLTGTATNASNAVTANTAATASYVLNAVSASRATSAATASYVLNAISASYALNGGVTQLLAGPNVTLSPTNGLGQVTISSTSGGGGFNTATGSYGSFYSTQTQTNVAGTARSMSLNITDITNGVSISGSTNPFNTYIKTQNAGVYDIQFSAQVDKTDSGTDEIWIWLRKNGTDISDSATSVQLVGNGTHYVAAWNFFVNAAANDYYQLMWYSTDANVRLHAETGFGVVPGIPSLIVTANRVDQFLSNTGSFSGSFTGSLLGTASFATTASFAQTSSYVKNAVSASYVLNAISSSYATTASYVNPLNQNVQITGSLTNGASNVVATGLYSHAEGYSTQASGLYSHAEGFNTIAAGEYSHTEGVNAQANGQASHAEGASNISYGIASHAEGNGTTATGDLSHSEGEGTSTNGIASHAEGSYTTANGVYSHAEGVSTIANETGSHTEGVGTITNANYQHAQGAWNIASSEEGAFILGNGTDDSSRSNLIFAAGNQVQITGSLSVTNTLLLDGNLIDSFIINPTIAGSNNLFTQATGSYTSAHGKYTVYQGANSRAGEFVTAWNGTTTSYYDNSTIDIGTTTDVTFQSSIATGQIQINATSTTPGWTVKMLVTYL